MNGCIKNNMLASFMPSLKVYIMKKSTAIIIMLVLYGIVLRAQDNVINHSAFAGSVDAGTNGQSTEKYDWQMKTSAGYSYKFIANDPTNSRFYTLKNGLTVILSVNKKEPRIRALVALRSGSNSDPANNTGLAHYLEHLLFKGTDKIGTKDWEKEKPLLQSIDSLYEIYNKTTDPSLRKEIYKTIDRVSGEAAKFAIANEYTKIIKDMGGQASNAHTFVEETVYEEYIPSNAIDKYLALQAERFRNPVLRIFHTELEAVYEEKNRILDNDARKLQTGMFTYLFPTTNYGLQSTIGTIEHLKNPSLVEIRKFYNNYYVPNNLGVILSGDFDPDAVIKKIDAAFAFMQPKTFTEYNATETKLLNGPVVKEIFGPTSESVRLCYRTPAAFTRDANMLQLINNILSNGEAGLLDLDLAKQQKVLAANSSFWQFKNHGILFLSASPKQGKQLEDIKQMLLTEIDKIKQGDFDESLIAATANNLKMNYQRSIQNNISRANLISDNFIQSKGAKWDTYLASFDEIASMRKSEVVAFAQKFFDENYLILYKRKGEDKTIQKVEKPAITALDIDKNAESPLGISINNIKTQKISPEWIDFNTQMKAEQVNGRMFLHTANKLDQQFKLTYYFEMGNYNNRKFSLLMDYIDYLGTKKMAAENFSKAFYNLACSYSTSVDDKTMTITLSGLNENFTKAVTLLEDLFRNCIPDNNALEEYKNRLIKARSNSKTNRANILNAMNAYARYGASNPYNYVLSDKEIQELTAVELTNELHQLFDYRHNVLYYGPKDFIDASSEVDEAHPVPAKYVDAAVAKAFPEIPTTAAVYFTDYDMVQAEMQWTRNAGEFDPYNQAVISVFNNYFGSGGSSFVYQVVRETKALAYSTYAMYYPGGEYEKKNYITGYIGSQADKFKEATSAMNDMFTTFPVSEKSFAAAKSNMLNVLETQRVSQDAILFEYMKNKKLGLDGDIRKTTYQKMSKLTLDDLKKFHEDNFERKPFTLLVLASEKKVTKEDMEKIGPVKKCTLEELFSY